MARLFRKRKRQSRRSSKRRSLVYEGLERRYLLAADWTNPNNPRDVNNDGLVTAGDALILVNELNDRTVSSEFGELPQFDPEQHRAFLDVNCDGVLTANDVLRVINALNLDTIAPEISVALVRDTAARGLTNEDLITSDGRLHGTATDDTGVLELFARIDGQTHLVPVTREGTFTIDPGFAVDGSDDGDYQIELIARDAVDNLTQPVRFTFTYDTVAPLQVDMSLASSTTGGLDSTTQEVVTLNGLTEANAIVDLAAPARQTEADSTGAFSFDQLTLELGNNQFTATAFDVAGNSVDETITVVRVVNPGGPNVAILNG